MLSSQPGSSARGRVLNAPPEAVWQASLAVLEGAPMRAAAQDRGMIQTGWVEGWGERPFGLLGRGSWRRRSRMTVRLSPSGEGTAVSVSIQAEEKAPAGRLGLRWQRAAADPADEAEFFKQLEEELGG